MADLGVGAIVTSGDIENARSGRPARFAFASTTQVEWMPSTRSSTAPGAPVSDGAIPRRFPTLETALRGAKTADMSGNAFATRRAAWPGASASREPSAARRRNVLRDAA